jgi:hypothetical protein
MPIFPVRDLAQKGVLRDPSPYQLDLNAWSNGKGVRFHANKVQSAPAFKIVDAAGALTDEPTFVTSYEPLTGYDAIFVTASDGRIWKFQNQSYAEVTASNAICVAPTMTLQGSGYAVPPAAGPTVTFSAATGTGAVTATGTAIVDAGGQVTGIMVTNPGWYPTGVAPTITIAAPGAGTTATATCVLGPVLATDPRAWTSTILGTVIYMNRPDRAPQWWNAQSANWSSLPNMECAWTCRSLRAFGDYMIALNVTKPTTFTDPYTGVIQNGGVMSNLFKWSDLTFAGQTPPDWDPDNPASSAGENPLEQLQTPIVDGAPLRNVFCVYSEQEVVVVEQTGTQAVFSFNYQFTKNTGLIAPNCVVEVDGVHYCFGPTDIYKHDGVTKVSIVDKRNRETIYRNLNKSLSEVCFVQYFPNLDSILFAYNTGDTNAAFQGADRCNFGALYDVANDTWGFVDLPNVSAATMANMDTVYAWSSLPAASTWGTIGGSWYDQQNTFVKSPVMVSAALSGLITAHRLCLYDFITNGNKACNYVAELNPGSFVERTGISLDQLGSDLRTYKRIRRVFPQVTVAQPGALIQVQIGYSNTPSGAVTWGSPISFDPEADYKVDTLTGGRYLAIRFSVSAPSDYEVAGFDCEVTDGGRR